MQSVPVPASPDYSPLKRIICSPLSSVFNPLRLFLGGLLLSLGLLPAAVLPDWYRPNPDNGLNVMVVAPDGSLVVGGEFAAFQNDRAVEAIARERIAKILPDGSIDITYGVGTDGSVHALAFQPDGKLVVGGYFTRTQDGQSYQNSDRKSLVRLNANSSIDSSFGAGVGHSFANKAYVYALAVQNDGKILVGGNFDQVYGTGSSAAQTCTHLVRFNADGTVDTSFSIELNDIVTAITLQSDGSILVAGGFTSVKGTGASAAVTRKRLVRLSSDGTVDATFDPGASDLVNAIQLQPDGKILVGGRFTTLTPNGGSTATSRSNIARLNADGTVDTSFSLTPNAQVLSIRLQRDGKLLIAGRFSEMTSAGQTTSVVSKYIARAHPNGTPDATFKALPDQYVTCMTVLDDGRLIIGGWFRNIGRNASSNSVNCPYIARLTPDGSLDMGFQVGSAGSYSSVGVSSDGKMYLAGNFSQVAGRGAANLVRLNANATIDTSFSAKITGTIDVIVPLSTGKVVIGGSFTAVNGKDITYLARLNADGSLDEAFDPELNGPVLCIAEQSDGKLLLGGSFLQIDEKSRAYIARLASDGSLDETFDPSANAAVRVIRIIGDRILIGGSFTSLAPNGSEATYDNAYLALLKSDGLVDTTFKTLVDNSIQDIEIQSDGKILLGGSLTAMRLDGKYHYVKYLARLNKDYSIDTDYTPQVNNPVTGIAVLPSDDIVIVGNFSKIGDIARFLVARLNADGTVDSALHLTPNTTISRIYAQTDGSVLMTGAFSWFKQGTDTFPTFVRGLARLTPAGALDSSFAAKLPDGIGGSVEQVSLREDRSVVVGGSFTNLGGLSNDNLVKFGPNGVPDSTFAPQPNGTVRSVLTLPLSQVIPVYSNRLYWLNADGSARSGDQYTILSKLTGVIRTALPLADGSLLIGGRFTLPGYDHVNLIKIKADGTIETTFAPQPNNMVYCLALEANGNILVGGAFTNIGGFTTNYFARLSPSGIADSTMSVPLDGAVTQVAVQTDGKIVLGGPFTKWTFSEATSTTEASTVSRAYLARITAAGALDSDWNPTLDAQSYTITVQSDNKVVISGGFTALMPNAATTTTTRLYMARLNTDGTLDDNFNPNFNAAVYSHIALSDGSFVCGGDFTTLDPHATGTSQSRAYLAKIKADSSLDTTFDPVVDGTVVTLGKTSDNAILVSGDFTKVDEVSQKYLIKLNASGEVVTSYQPDIDGAPYVLPLLADGSTLPGSLHSYSEDDLGTLIGGDFTKVYEKARSYLAMVNSMGQPSDIFNLSLNGAVHAMARQPNGKILVGGAFTTVEGKSRKGLVRLSERGVLDETFSVDIEGTVTALAVQTDGKILLGGDFTKVATVSATGLARLNADGSLDSTFNAGVNGAVSFVKPEADGTIYVGGSFTTVNGSSRPYLARLLSSGVVDGAFSATPDAAVKTLATTTDGLVIIGGAFTQVNSQPRARFATLTSSGGLADADSSGAEGGSINSLAVSADGRVYVGGSFTRFRTIDSYLLARTGDQAAARQSLTIDSKASRLSWLRSGRNTTLSSVVFDYSTDGLTYTRLGEASTPDAGATWELGGLSLPKGSNVYVRARGLDAVNQGGASSLHETVARLFIRTAPAYTDTLVLTGQLGSDFVLDGTVNHNSMTFTATGLPPGLSIDPTTGSIYGTPTQSGSYQVTVSFSDGMVKDVWQGMIVVSEGTPTKVSSYCSAFSARGYSSPDKPLIIGFIVSGNTPMKLVLRGVGPSLKNVEFEELLSSVRLEVYRHPDSTQIYAQDGWTPSDELNQTVASVGLQPFEAGSKDAAMVVTLDPGAYTFFVKGQNGEKGFVIAEVYDATPSSTTSPSRLTGCSARGYVDASIGGNLIGGVLTHGQLPAKTLIAASVELDSAGARKSNYMSDPKVDLYRRIANTDSHVAANGNYTTQVNLDQNYPMYSSSQILNTIPGGKLYSKDAAMMTLLPEGVYTFVGASANGESGEVILQFIMP